MSNENEKLKPSDVVDLETLCNYIAEHVNHIYVRVQLDGKWQNMSLAEMPSYLAVRESLRFVKEARMPLRYKE